MTLPELCEPFFQYVCRVNRSARKGAVLDESIVRNELVGTLSDMASKSAADPMLQKQYASVELPLIYFADFIIKESSLPFARSWRELAHDRNKLAGDEEFFDLLEETMRDSSEPATERLQVYYTCLGLGFTGFYTGQPEWLRKKMMEIAVRLRGRVRDDGAKVCPEAYEHTDTSDLIEPPGRSLLGAGIALVGLLAVLFIANAYLYHSSAGELAESLERISSYGVETPEPNGAGANAARAAGSDQ